MARKFELKLVAFILALMLALMLALSLSGMAKAWHVPSASVTPNQTWEGRIEQFTFIISNNNGDAICKINLTVNNFTIINVSYVREWDYKYTNNSIYWNSSSTGIGSSPFLFEFYARADFVNNTINDTWRIITIDKQNTTNFTQVNVTILNDANAPRILYYNPANGDFMKNGTNITFMLIINESESGVDNAYIIYDYVSAYGASSTINNNQSMTCNNNNCTTHLSLISNETKKYLNFRYKVADKAGNSNETTEMWLRIDFKMPSLTISSPSDNTIINDSLVNFTFYVDDDSFNNTCAGNCSGLNPELNCSLILNTKVNDSFTINTSGNYSFIENLSDGIHSWAISCIDKAGWQATSETRRLIIDTSAPKIELISPANNSYVKTNATFIWSASDLTNITCNLSIDGEINQTLAAGNGNQSFLANVSGLAEGLHNWSVTCWDEFSHSNASETLYFEVDVIQPNVTIIEPNQTSYSSTGSLSILFNFTAIDDKTNLSCSYVISGPQNYNGSLDVVNASYSNFTKQFTKSGSYFFNVTCFDQAGNQGSNSTSFNLTITGSSGGSGGGGGRGGGGGSSYYSCSPSWQCSEWSACIDGKQTRSCVDLNNCGGILPITEKSCEVNQTNQTINESIKSEESQGKGGESGGEGGVSVGGGSEGGGITGGVVGALKKSWIPLIIILGIIAIGYGILTLLKPKNQLAGRIKFYKTVPGQ
ncbi:MAG: hypothetical protein QW244_00175 [Candidatus Pacearchaeota archaeon]